MIQHFEKIENLGVFANYKKPASMVPFAKFNLIYGLNGSGKTTLSRFFSDLNTGSAAGFENLKYKITTDEGVFTQDQPYSRKIRVFNSEYVEANIGELEGTLNPIFVIGEGNKELAGVIKSDEIALIAAQIELAGKTKEVDKLKRKRGQVFTDIAKQITGHTVGTTTRNYNKTNAERHFNTLEDCRTLSIEELADASKSMKQPAMEKVNDIALGSIELKIENKSEVPLLQAFHSLEAYVSKIVQTSATSIAIPRLVDNPKIAQWVETGVSVHDHIDGDTCEFCQQEMPKARAEALAAHFNNSDRELRSQLEISLKDIIALAHSLESLAKPTKSAFYSELQKPYSEAHDTITTLKQPLFTQLAGLTTIINEKLTRRTESYYSNLVHVDTQPLFNSIQKANEVIEKQNAETEKFDLRLQVAESRIRKHFLSGIVKDVAETDKDIETIEVSIEHLTSGDSSSEVLGIDALKKEIAENRLKISNSHNAAEKLSEKLTSFLGRDDLRFESEGEGYRIMRFDRAAKRLSEGEKTAITFLYFVVGLQDQGFDLSEGIVVIDDPISSLDSSSVYQAFSFLKHAVKDARQIFLLTHNFEFLKLLLDWVSYFTKPKPTYWMLHCTTSDGTQRETKIEPLDKILLENKNELTYLFKILKNFESDGTLAQAYPIPNIARKVLETFLAQHSTGRNFHKKLENLEYDENKKTALYKYTNDLSHPTLSGLDPALVGETQTNVKQLLEMIKKVAPVHYNALTEAISGVT